MKQLWTRWGKKADPKRVLPEYPREWMKREQWVNLNGFWDCAFTSIAEPHPPVRWTHQILVPFSPETVMSGVERQCRPTEYLWYRRMLTAEEAVCPEGSRLLLHFGAVDQTCTVYCNGRKAAEHVGGYLPFTVDLTDYLKRQDHEHSSKDSPEEENGVNSAECINELILRIRDVSDTSYHARGKQKLHRKGMYYTAQSGIWQTVWMETVPDHFITKLEYHTKFHENQVALTVHSQKKEEIEIEVGLPFIYDETRPEQESCRAEFKEGISTASSIPASAESVIHAFSNESVNLSVDADHMWDCAHPWLYPVKIRMGEDLVESYFAFRKIDILPDEKGLPRIRLNEKEIFLKGVLDQGYWPESLMTPPSEEAMLFDLTEMKKFGFNLVRKHAKVEPDRWYTLCDRLGLLVWQDVVNGGEPYQDWFVTYAATFMNWMRIPVKDTHSRLLSRRDPKGRREFQKEILGTVNALREHPSVIGWTIFNEAWGQFETKECTRLLKSIDREHLIDSSSGWFDQGVGDVKSIHYYFLTFRMQTEKKRAFILSEFGGLPRAIPEHCATDLVYGYGTQYQEEEELRKAYDSLNKKMEKRIPLGLCATVYTQWTDIEDEVNGIYTYDREIRKM